MRIFKIRLFCKWAEKVGIRDSDIIMAVREIEDDLIDAFLAGCIYKKRISLQGKGKRSGARLIFAYQYRDRIFFLDAYAKNQKQNLDEYELEALKALGEQYLKYTDEQLEKIIITVRLFEVYND